jgi:hypothetical protein
MGRGIQTCAYGKDCISFIRTLKVVIYSFSVLVCVFCVSLYADISAGMQSNDRLSTS